MTDETARSYTASVVDEPVRGGFPDPSFYSLPGIEQARAWLRDLAPRSPLSHLIGIRPTQIGSGSATVTMPATPWLQTVRRRHRPDPSPRSPTRKARFTDLRWHPLQLAALLHGEHLVGVVSANPTEQFEGYIAVCYKRNMAEHDTWNPAQYGKFGAERARPFEDLLALVEPAPAARPVERVVDLGCGTGSLTARLHAHLGATTTVGIDSSAAMLEKARPFETATLRFELGDIAAFDGRGEFDVVFSNAALHWVPDHPSLLRRLRDALRPGGQLAVQVPANGDHPSHALPFEIAHEAPFRDALHDDPLGDQATPVLAPEAYATLLDELGFADQHVRLQVYGHHLASTADVVEWTKGTTLTRYERGLSPELYEQFVDRYRGRLLDMLGDHSPYFYTFKRVLFRARLV